MDEDSKDIFTKCKENLNNQISAFEEMATSNLIKLNSLGGVELEK